MKRFLSFLVQVMAKFAALLLTLALLGGVVAICLYFYFEKQLPDVNSLKNVQLQVPLRIFTSDHKLMAEFGEKRRIPVPINQVPTQFIHAILATEDQRFYQHSGVDVRGLARAAVTLLMTGKKEQGGSTITMQVARNFFLTRKKTYTRKIKEILLAIKINQELPKDKILSLYLNKIYLGNRAYGIAAAANVYYGKSLNELTLAQMAMIAGLPKAPSSHNPLANPTAALDRRNHVLSRMLDLGYISQADYQQAIAAPITASYHGTSIQVHAPYVAEMVRKALVAQFGKKTYTQGFTVYTTIDSKLQIDAEHALRKALAAYDRRHGYRGPIKNVPLSLLQNQQLLDKTLSKLPNYADLQAAVVTSIQQQTATVLTKDNQEITISWQGLAWARPALDNNVLGPKPFQTSDILKAGDIIYIEPMTAHQWRLAQIPEVEGALVALNPSNGAIDALVGGYDYHKSKFNRATQAARQPGSAFKPFIYSAALSKGYTLASIINDAPVVYNDPDEENYWRPQNDTRRFYGPTRLRVGLIKSRNLVSIRLLEGVGIDYTADFAAKFGFDPKRLPHTPSLALGVADVTPLELASGYAVFANGGYKVKPYFIAQLYDSNGQLIFNAQPDIACPTPMKSSSCQLPDDAATVQPQIHLAEQVLSPQVAYLMNSAMQDVIDHGTGRRAKVLHRTDIAGKTGTTNNQFDAWFAGYNHHLVTIAWVGFDKPRSIHEYGSQAALPMWIDFMGPALKGKPESSLSRPPGLVTMRISAETGLAANAGQKDTIFETFRKQYAPKTTAIDDSAHIHSTPSHSDENSEISNPEQIF